MTEIMAFFSIRFIYFTGDYMKKIIAAVFCSCIALGMLFRPQLVEMKDSMETKLFHPLSGVRIVLDPGHGGKDDGARADDAKEQTINLEIAKQTKAMLEEAGAKVTLTRDGAYDLASDGVKNRKRDDMKKRVNLINDKQIDLFISIHLNAYPSPAVRGTQVFFRKGDQAGEKLANMIQNHFREITKAKMVPKAGDYYILNETDKLGVLVECGFLSNPIDRKNLLQKDYQEKVANVLYVSIREYLQILDQ